VKRGARAERRAVWHYRVRGYRVLGTNVWAAGYELDAIVRRGRRLTFVEVKEKTGERYGSPLAMVHGEKERRIRLAADAWLARHPEHRGLACSFDVVEVRPQSVRRVARAF
jgi:putative endonuclease